MNRFRINLHPALFSFEDAKSTYEAPEKENPDTRINTENEWNNKERLNKKIRGLVNCIRDVKFENRDDKISFKKYDKDWKTIIERRVSKKFNKQEYYAEKELPGSYKRIRTDSIIIDENWNYKKSSEKSEFLIKIERENAKNKRKRIYFREFSNQPGAYPEDEFLLGDLIAEDVTPKKVEDLSPEKVHDELQKMRKEQETLTDVQRADELMINLNNEFK